MQNDFLLLFKNYLAQLKAEIEAYPSEESLWLSPSGISNSAGNLCLHLLGNLNHFIGHILGNTGYLRNRPFEFSGRNVPSIVLIENVDNTLAMLEKVLPGVQLENEFPITDPPFGKRTNLSALLHLAAHFNYHLGQINYHRRLLTAPPSA